VGSVHGLERHPEHVPGPLNLSVIQSFNPSMPFPIN
jgi:hypothetical protein